MNASNLKEIEKNRKRERRKLTLRLILSNNLLMIGIIILSLIILLAAIGPLITSYSPYEIITGDRVQPPSAKHLLGTDDLGRDLFTRIIYGAQTSLIVGLSIAIISSVIGMIIGLIASYYKIMDHILMRICDGLLSIPGILLAIALMVVLGPSTSNVIIALSIVFTPLIARIVRSKAIAIKEETYVEAMMAQGASAFRIIFLHIAPNALSPLIVQATFIFAESIITEAALSFLGAGVPTPDPSWGNILYDGKIIIFRAWWMTVFPGIAIILAVISLNFLGDGLRDILDPHVKSTSLIKKNRLLHLFKRKKQ